MATILIIEDEHAVARGIQYALQQEGYDVGVARSGEEPAMTSSPMACSASPRSTGGASGSGPPV